MPSPTLNYVLCPDASGGHRMAYWQWGDPVAGHLVVCAHGLSRQGRDFDLLARALLDRASQPLRVVCPDVAGRGQSDWLRDPMDYQIPNYAADMIRLLGQLHQRAPIHTLDWVGTSMGGLIGMVVCAALQSPGGVGLLPGANAAAGGNAAMSDAGAGVLAVAVRRLVLNDVGPTVEWQAVQRIGAYLGRAGRFESLQQAADAMWAVSSSFGPHTPEQWLALSQAMVRPLAEGGFTLHYDPSIGLPFRALTEELAAAGQAALWQLYDALRARTLLTRGAQSDLLSRETARAMTQRGPKARLVEFEGVGHAPTFVPDNQIEAVVSFLLAPALDEKLESAER